MIFRIFLVSLLIFLPGCAQSEYQLRDPVSPPLEGNQSIDEFFTHGEAMNYDITTNAVDNLMTNVSNL